MNKKQFKTGALVVVDGVVWTVVDTFKSGIKIVRGGQYRTVNVRDCILIRP